MSVKPTFPQSNWVPRQFSLDLIAMLQSYGNLYIDKQYIAILTCSMQQKNIWTKIVYATAAYHMVFPGRISHYFTLGMSAGFLMRASVLALMFSFASSLQYTTIRYTLITVDKGVRNIFFCSCQFLNDERLSVCLQVSSNEPYFYYVWSNIGCNILKYLDGH